MDIDDNKVDIDKLLAQQAEIDEQKKKIAKLFPDLDVTSATSSGAWKVGENYLIRTVTHIQTGRLTAVGSMELVLEDAAWIADTGRFSDNLKSCSFNEVEPFPEGEVIIGQSAIIDAVRIGTLPKEQK